jgi:hypothetical protein
VLRERFTGTPEFVKTFFEFLAEEVREYLAELGFGSLDEAIGQVHLLDVDRAIHHWKADGLDLSPILSTSHAGAGALLQRAEGQDHEIEKHFDQNLIALAEPALSRGEHVSLDLPIRNTERAVGTMLGHEVTKAYGEHGLPAGTIEISLTGAAGQSYARLGAAYQVQDDLADAFGLKGRARAGLDLREGKANSIVLFHLPLRPKDSPALPAFLRDAAARADDGQLDLWLGHLFDSGAVAAAQEHLHRLCDEITATAATLPAPFAPHLAALAAGIREPAIFQRTSNPTTCSGGL